MTIHRPAASRALVAAAALGLVLVSAIPAAAATPPPGDKSYSQNGATVESDSMACTQSGDILTCSDTTFGAFVGKMTDGGAVTHVNQVCVSLGSYAFNLLTGEISEPIFERGCATDLPSGILRFDPKLAWATLATTSITVEQLVCDKEGCVPGASRAVAVSGTWTAVGPMSTSKSRGSFDDGTCRYNEWFKGSGRSASFAGSIDGSDVSAPDSGFLSSGRSGFRSRCSEG